MMIGSLLALAALGAAQIETPVEATGPQGPLRGVMLSPGKDGAPLMLIIPGSGPTDRDGNNPLGVRASTYRLLAEGLAERGIATVRIDKRGMFESNQAVADPNAVTIDAYVADIGAWTKAMRARTDAPCVWLLGHSEGGLVALAAADAPDICGLVLVATAGRPFGDVLREQLRANPANAPLLDQAFEAIDRLEAGDRVDVSDMHPALVPLFQPGIQGFLSSLLSRDPAALLARYDGPALIVQGQRDIQVGAVDAERLKAAKPAAKLVMLPNVNHVLKAVQSDERVANLATYANPDLPLADGVVAAIADFIDGQNEAR